MYLYGSNGCFLACKWEDKGKYVMLLSYFLTSFSSINAQATAVVRQCD